MYLPPQFVNSINIVILLPSVHSGTVFTSIVKQPPHINCAFSLLLFKLGAGFYQLLVELPHMHRLDCVHAAVCNERKRSRPTCLLRKETEERANKSTPENRGRVMNL